ncbi:hypothetical protein UFOVP29_212 [uncultured Caudovirales phage]|uniref:Uncharacterized protein n=1 Tax=uncultured Caudovirales phage TaxID=2100421 RepID=A0A6J5KP93_9CAUD|nr:hypothetical protein UFOVP29_212 [uncultured Caudovirales phage]
MTDFPKAQFKYIGNTYTGAAALGVDTGNLTRDRADSLIRDLCKTAWLEDNATAYRLWVLGGDPWAQFVKDLVDYTRTVRAWERQNAKKAAKKG